ncbi:hypothetical protein ACFLSA_02490 [Bacteroidota bacterium]
MIGFLIFGCERIEYKKEIDFINTEVECINGFAEEIRGEEFCARIDNNEQLDSLFFCLFTEYLAKRNPKWLEKFKNEFPDSTKPSELYNVVNYYIGVIGESNTLIWLRDDLLKDCIFPDLDFERYTLLWQTVTTGTCRSPFKVKTIVYKNNNKKELTFLINILNSDRCKGAAIRLSEWILIKKLPIDHKINYEVNIKTL